jgi:uncharacterized membrane protein YvbJ
MPYCLNCGAKLSEDAAFCPKCGTKVAGISGATNSPSDELREAFNRMSVEMEKAFNIAAREVQEAFQVARNNVQKTIYKEPQTCVNCGEKNPASAAYCFKCGKKLVASAAEPKEDKNPL